MTAFVAFLKRWRTEFQKDKESRLHAESLQISHEEKKEFIFDDYETYNLIDHGDIFLE